MITDDHIFGKDLPPGYEQLESEPTFDAATDLALEGSATCATLADLGYDREIRDLYPSPIAITEPFRLLTDVGVKKIEMVISRLKRYAIWSGNADGPGIIRGAVYRSTYLRNLCLCINVADMLSRLAETPLAISSFGHQLGHINLAPRGTGGPVGNWHVDQNAFVIVLCLYEQEAMQGGEFEYYRGTRTSGFRELATGGKISPDHVAQVQFPGPGYAILMQGSAVVHRGSPVMNACDRVTMVNAYEPRNVGFPDANPTQLVADHYGNDPNGVIERRVRPVELARHKARRVQAHLDDFINEIPWTVSNAELVEGLASSVREILEAVAALKEGDVDPAKAFVRYMGRLKVVP